jgi:hypothetical protein
MKSEQLAQYTTAKSSMLKLGQMQKESQGFVRKMSTTDSFCEHCRFSMAVDFKKSPY